MGRTDRRSAATVILKAAGGAWTTIGGEHARGIVPQGLVCSANESGPDTCGFTLRRRASVPWPDLKAFNQCEIQIGGLPVWGGRVWEAPLSDGGEDSIAVAGRGWQYHLDDDLISRYYVHTDLGAWRDIRSAPAVTLTTAVANGSVQVGSGAAVFGWVYNTSVVNATGAGITLDLGPGRTAKRIVVTFATVNPNAFCTVYARAHSTPDPFGGSVSDAFATSFGTIASPAAGTFATPYRYVSLFLYRSDGSTSVVAGDHLMQVTKIQVFSATAYESGNASVLKASDVIEDVLGSGALPLLDSATDQISASSFSIPDLSPSGYQTARALIAAANAYEGNLVGVDLNRKLFYRERATAPLVEVGDWPGSSFQDQSTNSAEGIYNRVIVQGTGPDGSPIAEVRTLTSGLLDDQGFDRTATLQVSAPMTTASAQALGDIWLAQKANPAMKGSLVVTGHGGARRVTGGGIHPSELMLRVGEKVRLGHLVDPADGSMARDSLIKSVSYAHDSETATLELDSERGNFETFLERLAVVTTQALR